MALTLAGCSSTPDSINPVVWWHQLQGGAIAEQRPPPPGADQPYPNLASVPDRPASPDMKLHQQIAAALVADRANAQREAASAPLADPSSPTASPALFGRGTIPPAPPPGQSDAPSASLQAATAPPAPAAPPASAPAAETAPQRAPVGAVQTTPRAAASEGDAATALPSLSAAPPGRPSIPGVDTAAAAPPAPPRAAAVAPSAVAAPKQVGAAVPIAFAPGSSTLPTDSVTALRLLASRRQRATVMVSGFGEAVSSDPQAQSDALTLALSRAQVMAAALAAAGVPAASVRVDAQAAGRGGAARLVE